MITSTVLVVSVATGAVVPSNVVRQGKRRAPDALDAGCGAIDGQVVFDHGRRAGARIDADSVGPTVHGVVAKVRALITRRIVVDPARGIVRKEKISFDRRVAMVRSLQVDP